MMDSTGSTTRQPFSLSPLQTFLATAPAQSKPQSNASQSMPAVVPAVVEERLNGILMTLTVLRGRVAELSQNMSTMSTTMEQIAKDLSDMKRKPALISDEQICRLIDEIAPRLRTSEELPDSAVHILQELQNLPAELTDKLRSGLLKGQQNSTTIKDAFEEVLDRRNKANREGEQDSVAKIPESLQDPKTKFSPLEAFTQTAQHLLSIAKALGTHVTKDPSDNPLLRPSTSVPTGRELLLYSREGPQTASSLERPSNVTQEESERRMDRLSGRIDAAVASMEVCVSENDRNLKDDENERKIKEKEREISSPEHHDLLKRLNTIEHKLDVLLGTCKPLCDNALEARPHLDKMKEAPCTSLSFERCAVQDPPVSAEQRHEITDQFIHSPDYAHQLAISGPDATECDVDLITAQFPPLIPERNHALSAISYDPIVGRSQDPEESRMPGQPEIRDFVALKRTPPIPTRSPDRFDGNRTTPYRKRKLIKLSSDDEEDGRETVKRNRSGLSLDEDDVGSFNVLNPFESDDAGKEEGSPGSSDLLIMTAEKPRNYSPSKTNSGLLQSRRRISVSPDLP